MSEKTDVRRRRIAVLGGSAAAMTSTTSILTQHGHQILAMAVLAVGVGTILYAAVEFVRFRRDCRRVQ